MSHNQRLSKLIKKEGLNSSQFCKSISYTLKNLSNYVNAKTTHPNGELVIGIIKHYPHWNLRYWLLDEGEPFLKDDKIVILKEPAPVYKDPIVQELTEQLSYMRKEIVGRDEIIKELKSQLEK